MKAILQSKDLWSGAMFVAFGAAALVLGAGLRAGTAARMGPGYVPRMLGWMLLALGIAIAMRGLLNRRELVEPLRWRPVAFVPLAVASFALLLPTAGLAAAVVALVVLAAVAGPRRHRLEAAAVGIVMVLICVGIFKLGLGMQIEVIRGVW